VNRWLLEGQVPTKTVRSSHRKQTANPNRRNQLMRIVLACNHKGLLGDEVCDNIFDPFDSANGLFHLPCSALAIHANNTENKRASLLAAAR